MRVWAGVRGEVCLCVWCMETWVCLEVCVVTYIYVRGVRAAVLPIDETFLFLSVAPHSRSGLLVGGWVPVRIEQDQPVAPDPDSTHAYVYINAYIHVYMQTRAIFEQHQVGCMVWSINAQIQSASTGFA